MKGQMNRGKKECDKGRRY